MTKQTITAFFDSREYANNAALMLQQAGVPQSDVLVSPEDVKAAAAGAPTGFWASLEELFGGSDDHHTYAEGLRRGGVMVTAHVDDPKVDDAVRILEQHGSVDLDERESTWRSEGWTGAPVTRGGIASTGAGPLRDITPVRDRSVDLSAAATGAAVAAPVAVSRPQASTQDGVLQVVEESLDVGKRAVSRGKVRLHSYVVEKPVSASVTLRDETVTIDRRPVDRPFAAGAVGADAFAERTIEMEETNEEAVVAKTARVVEEVGLRKDVKDDVRTITDTVRSTKVDVEDERSAGGAKVGAMSGASLQPAADMEVVGADGIHVGVIDHVDGASLKLKKVDPAAGGQHHLIPVAWVSAVEGGTVTLSLAADEAKRRWTAA